MNAEEQKQWLEERARELVAYLEDNDAVKRGDNEKPGRDFPAIPREELEDVLDLDQEMFQPVKVTAVGLGYQVAISNRGHYLGRPGEAITYNVFANHMIAGLATRQRDYFMAMGQAGTLEDAEQFARRYLGTTLNEISQQFKALGVAMDRQTTAAIAALTSDNGSD